MPEVANHTAPVHVKAPAAENNLSGERDLVHPEPERELDLYRRRIQPKLAVGAPDDPFEKEADTMADTVMRMPEKNFVQLKCAECEKEEQVQRKTEDQIQRKSEEQLQCKTEDQVQRKSEDQLQRKSEDQLQRKPISETFSPSIQRSLSVPDEVPADVPATDISRSIPIADKRTHFNNIIQSLCSSFAVDAATGLVAATTNPAPTPAALSTGAHPLGCCGINILVNGVNDWKIEMSQLQGPHTFEPPTATFVLPPPGSPIHFGNFTAAGGRTDINDVVVAGHEMIGHGAQMELDIHNQGDEDRESFNHHDPTVRVQNILAHEQGIPASEDRGSAASSLHRGESYARIEIDLFEFNSHDIPASEQAKLALIAQYITTNNTWVDIIGHSDPIGSDAAKQQVSQDRADAVQAALLRLGVTRLMTRQLPTYTYTNRRRFTRVAGVSDTQPPLTGADDNANWRRVEIFAATHPAGAEVPPRDIPALQPATPGAGLATERASTDPCHQLLVNSAFPVPAAVPAAAPSAVPAPASAPAVPAAPVLQPKLSAGAQNSVYEKEADKVADKVMRAPQKDFIQQKCAHCQEEEQLQRKPVTTTITPFIQAKAGSDTPAVSDAVSHSIDSSKGSGSSMDNRTSSFMSDRFGADFSDVKIHTGSESAQLNRSLNAKAFTTGRDIFFNEGQYQPGSDSGKHLLAHELTHVVQQNAAIQRQPMIQRDGGDKKDAPPAPNLWPVKPASDSIANVKKFYEDIGAKGQFTHYIIVEKDELQLYDSAGTKQDTYKVTRPGLIDASGYYFGSVTGGWAAVAEPEKGKFVPTFIGEKGVEEAKKDTDAGKLIRDWDEEMTILQWFSEDDRKKFLDKTGAKAWIGLAVMDVAKPHKMETKKEGPVLNFSIPPWFAVLQRKINDKKEADKKAATDLDLLPDKIFYYGSDKVQKDRPNAWTIEVQKGKKAAFYTITEETYNAAVNKDTFTDDTWKILKAKVKQINDEKDVKEKEQKEINEIDGTGKDEKSKGSKYAWALTLKKKIDAILASQKVKEPKAEDFPDKLSLTAQADASSADIYLRVAVYRKTDHPQPTDIPELIGGAFPTALKEDDKAEDWAPLVRKFAAALRTGNVTTDPNAAKDQKDPANPEEKKADPNADPNAPKGAETILAPYPARIFPRDMNPNLTTATIASNTFRMVLDLEAVHGKNLLNLTTINMGMMQVFSWKIFNLPDPLKELKKNDQVTQDMFLQQANDYTKEHKDDLGTPKDTYKPDYDWEQKVDMDSIGLGDFLLEARAGINYNSDSATKRAASFAGLPFTVKDAETLAKEAATSELDPINAAKKQLEQEKDHTKADNLKQQIADMEAHDKEDVISRAIDDLKSTRQLTATAERLKKYIQADREKKIHFEGDATHDPFLLRLKAFDKQMYSVYVLIKQLYDYRTDDVVAVDEYIKTLKKQEEELDRLQKRATAIKDNDKLQEGSPLYRTVSALVKEKDGNVIPITLMVGRHKDSKIKKDKDNDNKEVKDDPDNRYKMMIFDVTFDSPKKDDMVYVGDEAATEEAAIQSAFVQFGKDNKYGDGKIVYRVPQLNLQGTADSVTTWYEYLEYALAAVGIALLIAGAVISGGALAPASAAAIGGVVSALGLAAAVVGAAFAARNIYKRVEKGTFELDAAFALDVISIVGAFVQVGATTARLATMSRGIGAAAKAVQIQRIGNVLHIYEGAELTGNIVFVSLKIRGDVEDVKKLHLPPEQEEEMMQQIAIEAVQTGAMLAYASVSKVKDIHESLSSRVEHSGYETFKEKGWMTEEGKPTESAPPFLKNQTAEPGKLPSPAQQGDQAWHAVKVEPLGSHPSTVEPGHEFTVTEKGRIIRCSDFCTDMRMKFGHVLERDPYINEEMTVLEQRAKTAAATNDKEAAARVATDAAAFEGKLKTANELHEHLFGASEEEWKALETNIDNAEDTATAGKVTGGPKSGSRIDDIKIPKRQRRTADTPDFMTEPELKTKGGYEQATERIHKVVGRKISEIDELKTHWDATEKELMGGKTADELGRDKMIDLYKSAQRKFWARVREDPKAVKFLKDNGFSLEGESGAALLEMGPIGKQATERGHITDQERRISLDHIKEKAQSDNWKMALSADNLELMLQNANSWKEITQNKFHMRDNPEYK